MAQDQCVRFLELSQILPLREMEQLLPNWRQPDAKRQTVLEVTGAAVAQTHQLRFLEGYQGLERIDRAGTIIGYDGQAVIATPHDDCILIMPSLRQARPGVTVVRFARERCVRG